MDKSWIHLSNRMDPTFLAGLNSFIDRCNDVANSEGKAHCPCKKCVNQNLLLPSKIFDHIFINGFYQYYDFWTKHGEERTLPAESEHYWPEIGTSATTNTDQMFDLIHDVMREQDTNGEDMEEDMEEDTMEFDELFQELNNELYPGCTWMSSLNFLAKSLHLKVMNKWTDSSFTQFLELLREAFPKGNRIPASNYEAKKKMRKIGLGYENIHACANDCALFWMENKDEEYCPVCKESRWVDENTKGKKVPRKVLRYFPLTPRLKRKYGSKSTAKDMIWHYTGRSTDGLMRHPVDAKAWMDKFIAQSIANTSNRAQHQYTSSHGSASYAQQLYRMRNDKTLAPENAGPIQVWYNNHLKPKPNDVLLKELWGKIQKMRTTMKNTEAREDGSIDEVECLRRVLGSKRGFQPGVGRIVRSREPEIGSSSSLSTETNQDIEERLMEKMRQEMSQQMTQQVNQQMQQFMNQIRSMNPSLVLPDMSLETPSHAVLFEGEEEAADD